MFSFFKKKNPAEKLEKEYKKLMEEAYKLQSIDRRKSDTKYAEAEETLKRLKKLRQE